MQFEVTVTGDLRLDEPNNWELLSKGEMKIISVLQLYFVPITAKLKFSSQNVFIITFSSPDNHNDVFFHSDHRPYKKDVRRRALQN